MSDNTDTKIEFAELKARFVPKEVSHYKDYLHVYMRPQKVKQTAPVCIVCVVDISSSMQDGCCQNIEGMEYVFLSRLDLIKHSLKTLISTLRDSDMVSVIVFNENASVVVDCTVLINQETKERVIEKIDSINSYGMTNMWSGILLAMDTLDSMTSMASNNYQKSIMVFTDGHSNMNPPGGILNALKTKLGTRKSNFTISTFSFGNSINVDLLIDIAKIGNGIYGFCPDASMVGTIFINYMANILSTITAITNVTVTQGDPGHKQSITLGPLYRSATRNALFEIDRNLLDNTKITVEFPLLNETFDIPLDINPPNLENYIHEMIEQNGNGQQQQRQNQNIIFDINNDDDDDDFDELLDEESDDETVININDIDTNKPIIEEDITPMPYEELLINQIYRNKVIDKIHEIIITELVVYNENHDFNYNEAQGKLFIFFNKLKTLPYKTKFIKSLINDIDHPDPNHGQIAKAISSQYYTRWGQPYLYSFLRFHQFEQCGNFKDLSLQYYAQQVFSAYRAMANTIFINLPPPIHRNSSGNSSGNTSSGNSIQIQMRNLVNRHGGCFNGQAKVLLANGQIKCVKDLKKGDRLNNNAIVQCLIEQTYPKNRSSMYMYMCNLNGVLFTPYHPVSIKNQWYFPIDLVQDQMVPVDSWFNLVLKDEENKKYEVEFTNGIKAITLGHYRTENKILAHPYFGTDAVLKDLQTRDPLGYDNGYILINELKNPRQLEYDDNHYCINYYKVSDPTENTRNEVIVSEALPKKLVY